jgi:hypothetical protein
VVLDVEGVVVVELRQPARLAREAPVMGHVNRGVAEPRGLFVVVEAVVAAQLGEPFLELEGEAVEEVRTRAPQELDAQLPGRLRLGVEGLRRELEILEEVPGKDGGGAFADADDADVRAADDADVQMRQLLLERQRGHEAGAAAAQDDDRVDFHGDRSGEQRGQQTDKGRPATSTGRPDFLCQTGRAHSLRTRKNLVVLVETLSMT